MPSALLVDREQEAVARVEIDLRLLAMRRRLNERLNEPSVWTASPARFAEHLSDGQWRSARHLELLSETLHWLATTPDARLIVEMPPRHGKSETTSHWFPAWYLDQHPDQRIILASYEAGFATGWGRKVRNTLQENADELTVRISDDSAASNRWDTTRGGGMVCAGVGGPITGRGANGLVIDDPIKNAEEALSPVHRENVWQWWKSTARTRLEPGGWVVILMTRWHEDDLVGRLLREAADGGEQWRVLRLPALAEGDDPLGREPGEPLWPERYGLAALSVLRGEDGGDWVWDALYQQRPGTPGGAIFARPWWADGRNRFDATDRVIVNRSVGIYLSFDTAFKETESAAYTACVVGELWPDYRLAIREVWRAKLPFPELVPAIEATAERYLPGGKLRAVIIEDRASGTSAYQTLHASANDWLRALLVAFQPSGSKAERAKQAAVWCRNNCVQLPEPSASVPWLHTFEAELFTAPTGVTMDQVDAFSQEILYLENILAEGRRARGKAA